MTSFVGNTKNVATSESYENITYVRQCSYDNVPTVFESFSEIEKHLALPLSITHQVLTVN